MKNLIILYAGDKSSWSDNCLLDCSALDLSKAWAHSLPNVSKIEIISEKLSLFSLLKKASFLLDRYDCDTLVFAHAFSPFYNETITRKLLTHHKKYVAEYTFADGFPFGIAPEIVHRDTVNLLEKLAESDDNFVKEKLSKTSLFELLQKDINAFEIETILSKKDYRTLRLDFSCDTKNNFLSCKNLIEAMESLIDSPREFKPALYNPYELCDRAASLSSVLRTVPTYYEIQVVDGWEYPTIYDPYSIPFKGKDFLSVDKFQSLCQRIESFSSSAVISLSLYGDPLLHPHFFDLCRIVLEKPNLSLLIETDALHCDKKLLEELSDDIKKAPVRINKQNAINWIVRLDSFDETLYKKIRRDVKEDSFEDSFKKAQEGVALLGSLFPHTVYAQFVRMTENEEQLESFYRYWKEVSFAKVLIQKYDSVAGFLQDRLVADVSPIERNICWHIRRDMCIVLNGNVPVCRESLFDRDNERILGNVWSDSLESIFEKGSATMEEHLQKNYCKQCRACDEYYTFNF